MTELLVQLTKRADGGALLRCVRANGSTTWQRHEGRQAAFFPLHDLTHLAVETTLGCRHGFYGLLADGWDIDDTGGKGARGPLPAEARTVEHLVGFLDVERATGAAWTAAEVTAHLAAAGAGSIGAAPLTDDDLTRIRERRRDLFARWAATPPGAVLELPFARPAPAAARDPAAGRPGGG
jgi:hypothetical protein